MLYGYCRISTKQQFLDGTYKQQIQTLTDNNVSSDKIFFDNESGKNAENRIELNNLLNTVRKGDTVIVTKLDRLARNVVDALNIAQTLLEKEVVLNVLDLGVIDNTATGRLIFTIFGAFAEFERSLIVERLQSGRQYKRENDPEYREGRKMKLNLKQIENLEKIFEMNTMTNQEIADLYNVSRRTILYRKKEWTDKKKALELSE